MTNLYQRDGQGWYTYDEFGKYEYMPAEITTEAQARAYALDGKIISVQEAIMASKTDPIESYALRAVAIKDEFRAVYDKALLLMEEGIDTGATKAILESPIVDGDGKLAVVNGTPILVADLQQVIGVFQMLQTNVEAPLAAINEKPRAILRRPML